MNFENMSVKSVEYAISYKDSSNAWTAKNRKNHFIGIKLNGVAFHDFGYQNFTMKEGSVYFFNQKDDYRVEVYEKGESLSVHFTTYEEIDTDSFCIDVQNIQEIISLLRRMERHLSLPSYCRHEVTSDLYRLFSIYEKQRRGNAMKKDRRLEEARGYADLNFRNGNCLDEASKLCGVSRRRFNELFRIQYGVTPNRYLIEKKIGMAKELLWGENYSVSKIAEICGFCDTYYFCKQFKKETGQTPLQYRNENRSNLT